MVVRTSWRMPYDFTTTVPLTMAVNAVDDGPAGGQEGRLTAIDNMQLCQSADGCDSMYPKCNKQSLDVLVLVDNSGSISGRAKFEKARTFIHKLRKYVEADSQLAEPQGRSCTRGKLDVCKTRWKRPETAADHLGWHQQRPSSVRCCCDSDR